MNDSGAVSTLGPASAGTDSALSKLWIPLVAALTLAAILAAAIFYANGGRWFVVETPSMGQAAPVGTLVLTQPRSFGDIQAGDVVTFHPPTAPSETYTHRVIGRTLNNARLITKGDANGAIDPWQLSQPDLIGSPTAVLPGVGWLMRGLPALLLGAVALFGITRRFRPGARRSIAEVLGLSLLVAGIVAVLRPFTGFVVMATSPAPGGGLFATIVSTGLLPIRLQVQGDFPLAQQPAQTIDLVDGQVGQLFVPAIAGDGGHYVLGSALSLSPGGWVIFGLICAIPLLWMLLVGVPHHHPEAVVESAPDEHQPRELSFGDAD